jgi:hypothetical protein
MRCLARGSHHDSKYAIVDPIRKVGVRTMHLELDSTGQTSNGYGGKLGPTGV